MADGTNNCAPRVNVSFWRHEVRSARVVVLFLVLGIGFGGCGEKPPAAYRDFSKTNSVGVILGEMEREFDHGLQHLYHEKDGFTQPATVRNLACRCLSLTNHTMGYLYFKIDPTFKKRKLNKVTVEVEYFDDSEGQFGIQYDAGGSPQDIREAYTFLRESVELGRSRAWQMHTFEVSGATFKNNQNSGADFRLWVSPPNLCVRSVKVTRVR